LFEHDLRANAFSVCREGQPLHTFPDHALVCGLRPQPLRADVDHQRRQQDQADNGVADAAASAEQAGAADHDGGDGIEDTRQRAICEARSLRLARALLVDGASFDSIGAVMDAARKARNWMPEF